MSMSYTRRPNSGDRVSLSATAKSTVRVLGCRRSAVTSTSQDRGDNPTNDVGFIGIKVVSTWIASAKKDSVSGFHVTTIEGEIVHSFCANNVKEGVKKLLYIWIKVQATKRHDTWTWTRVSLGLARYLGVYTCLIPKPLPFIEICGNHSPSVYCWLLSTIVVIFPKWPKLRNAISRFLETR